MTDVVVACDRLDEGEIAMLSFRHPLLMLLIAVIATTLCTVNTAKAKTVEELKKAGDVRDPWKSTREYSGRALMYALNKTKDQVVLNNAIQPLVDALDQGQVDLERRRYAAVALSAVVMRLERVDLLRPRMNDLLAATFKDPDKGVRKYAERALQHTLMKLNHESTLTLAAQSLARQLDSKDTHFRSYSAVMLSGVVRKIKNRDTLKSLFRRITPAATKDRDKGVREYAGRAMRHIQHALKPKPEQRNARTKTK
jgi:hypothetical protein